MIHVPQPNLQLPQNHPKVGAPLVNPQPQPAPKIHVPQPNLQLPQNHPKVGVPHVNPQPQPAPKIHVPQPNLQLPQNNPKVGVPQVNPQINPQQPHVNPQPQLPQTKPILPLPPGGTIPPKHDASKPHLPANTVPGAAGSTVPGVGAQPNINLLQQGSRNPTGDAGKPGAVHGSGPSKLPPFTTNPPGTPNPKTLLQPDPKLKPNPVHLNPGLGNQTRDPNAGNSPTHVVREHLPLKVDKPIAGVQKQTVPLHVPKISNAIEPNPKNTTPKNTTPVKNPDQLNTLLHSKNDLELHRNLEQLKHSPDLKTNPQLAHLKLDKISGLHQDRLQHGDSFQQWKQTNVGQQLNLDRQFQLQRHGDLTRQMNLSVNVINAGGWQNRHYGAISPAFTTGSMSVWYAGGGCYPSHCWYPRWSPWVSWCWWDSCVPFYDPRPVYCRPVVYQPCQPWVYYDYPVWQPLPVVTCGTWVDVQPVVIPVGLDVQMLAVRFVDNGHSEQNLGPRYRVWVRNNSPVQITAPFSVLALAGNDPTPTADMPQAGVVIPTMDIGEIKPVDLRLPLLANRLGTTPDGYRVPFNYLHILVDSHQQIAETDESNNGSVVSRTDILPVDPAAFSTDLTAASPGTTLTIAGEGFGPEPGRVLVSVDGQQTEAVIQGWYDLGIRFTVPDYTLTGVVDADILVVRGDGAVSNPLDLDLAPPSMLGQVLDIPAVPIPEPPQ